MTLVDERPHNKHGSSVFVRDGLKVNSISVCEEYNVEFRSGRVMGRFKQIVTHPQRETAEIIQQCNMEEGIQPRPHLCIFKHLGYV